MAQTTRERIIANRGRKMSAKQIRYFGSARQRAALKSTRKRASSSRPGHAHRKNKGERIVGYTYRTNTGKKGHRMAKPKRKIARRSSAGYGRTKKRRNRGRPKAHSYGHRRRATRHNTGRRRYHRNPGMGLGNITGLAMNAVFAIAGAVGSKLLTQMVLGSNNTGVIGYAGNAVAGGALWFLAEKVLKNRNAAHGVIIGTSIQIVLRILNDYTPFGQYLALSGFGDYQAQSFVTPQVLVDPWNSAEISIPPAYRALAAPMAAARGVGSWDRRSDYDGRSDY